MRRHNIDTTTTEAVVSLELGPNAPFNLASIITTHLRNPLPGSPVSINFGGHRTEGDKARLDTVHRLHGTSVLQIRMIDRQLPQAWRIMSIGGKLPFDTRVGLRDRPDDSVVVIKPQDSSAEVHFNFMPGFMDHLSVLIHHCDYKQGEAWANVEPRPRKAAIHLDHTNIIGDIEVRQVDRLYDVATAAKYPDSPPNFLSQISSHRQVHEIKLCYNGDFLGHGIFCIPPRGLYCTQAMFKLRGFLSSKLTIRIITVQQGVVDRVLQMNRRLAYQRAHGYAFNKLLRDTNGRAGLHQDMLTSRFHFEELGDLPTMPATMYFVNEQHYAVVVGLGTDLAFDLEKKQKVKTLDKVRVYSFNMTGGDRASFVVVLKAHEPKKQDISFAKAAKDGTEITLVVTEVRPPSAIHLPPDIVRWVLHGRITTRFNSIAADMVAAIVSLDVHNSNQRTLWPYLNGARNISTVANIAAMQRHIRGARYCLSAATIGHDDSMRVRTLGMFLALSWTIEFERNSNVEGLSSILERLKGCRPDILPTMTVLLGVPDAAIDRILPSLNHRQRLIVENMRAPQLGRDTLNFSPPGTGKTTFLAKLLTLLVQFELNPAENRVYSPGEPKAVYTSGRLHDAHSYIPLDHNNMTRDNCMALGLAPSNVAADVLLATVTTEARAIKPVPIIVRFIAPRPEMTILTHLADVVFRGRLMRSSQPDQPLTPVAYEYLKIFQHTGFARNIYGFQVSDERVNEANFVHTKAVHMMLAAGMPLTPQLNDHPYIKAISQSSLCANGHLFVRQRKALFQLAKPNHLWTAAEIVQMDADLSALSDYVVRHADVVITTITGAMDPSLYQSIRAMLCGVDEAGRATEAELCVPDAFFNTARAVMKLGGHFQLGPQFRSSRLDNPFADQMKLSQFERSFKLEYPRSQLLVNHRSCPDVMHPYSVYGYFGLLQQPVGDQESPGKIKFTAAATQIFKNKMPKGSKAKGTIMMTIEATECRTVGTSKANLKSSCVVKHTIELLMFHGYDYQTVCIIVPYAAQKKEMEARLEELSNVGLTQAMLIQVHTIDSFQGRECDVVVLDLVATSHPGFMNQDKCRLNTALSRARFGNIIVADGQLYQLHWRSS
ncbi:AAA domain-containing protein 3 [Elsinoe fawcettii]|nr:AAA domain-containing protein 3 [Elsinoe fawcettii]